MSGQQRDLRFRFLAEPADVNYGGKVHGGTVMKWIDEAGYACATGWAKRYCVTVYVDGIRFHRPIRIGDLVEVQARLAYTGNSSMNIAVEVRSGDIKAGTVKMYGTTTARPASPVGQGRPERAIGWRSADLRRECRRILDDFAARDVECIGFGIVTLQRPRTVREPFVDLMDVTWPVESPMGPRVLAGFENHGGRTHLAAGQAPLGRVLKGHGNNDGDGWDTRLHYLAPGANMGYPMLYQNFKTEHFPSLADYGPGSGVGGLWIQDPAWPAAL